MKKYIKTLLLTSLLKCSNVVSGNDVISIDTVAATDIQDRRTDNFCPQRPTVYPEDSEIATLESSIIDLQGNEYQQVTIDIISPVILGNGGDEAQLVINSSVQRTMVNLGTRTGLYRISDLEQNSCGYVYRLHIGFASLGCELRTCRAIRAGERFRFQLNACSSLNNQCLLGSQRELVVNAN